jgi:hypothetical protein
MISLKVPSGPPDIATGLYLKITHESTAPDISTAFQELIGFFDILNTTPTKAGQFILTSYTYRTLQNPLQKTKYQTIVLTLAKSLHLYGALQKFPPPKLRALLELTSELTRNFITPNQTLKPTIYSITSHLVKMTINHPPVCRQIFDLLDIKGIMTFLSQTTFSAFKIFKKIFEAKPNLVINTYRMFERKMPMNLGLEHGSIIENPLDVPELRKYLLKEGEVWVSDAELKSIVKNENFDGFSSLQVIKMKGMYVDLGKRERLKEVLDRELGGVMEEFSGKFGE